MKRKETVTIGSELKEILRKRGMSAYRLSKELGVTAGYLSRFFNDRYNPSYGLVKKIAEMLGYDLRLVKKQSQKKGGETRKLRTRQSTGRKGDRK